MKEKKNSLVKARALAALICIALGLLAALIVRPRESARLTGSTATKSPAAILAAIHKPAPDTSTGKAIAAALERAARTPNEPKSWVNLGDALSQGVRETASQTADATVEDVYGRALQLQPRNTEALVGLAWVTGSRHQFDQSVTWAKKALAIDSGNATAYGIVGDAELELGQYDAAYQSYQKMMDLRPDLSSYSRSGYLLWLTGHRTKALWLMEKAVRAGTPFAENTAWCRAKLALMLFDDGALLPAWQTLEPVLTAAPRNLHVLLAAGRITAAQHNVVAARDYYQKALAVSPNIEALAALGDLAAREGNKSEAESYYQKVEALHAANLAGRLHDHVQMARFYADHDRNLAEAVRLAEQNKLTANVLSADTLAWVYYKHGDQAKALEAIKRALHFGSLDPATHFHAGMIAARSGDLSAARHQSGMALSYNSEFNLLDPPVARRSLKELSQARQVAAAPVSSR